MRSRVAEPEEGAQITGGLGSQGTGPWDRRVVQVDGGPSSGPELSLSALEEVLGSGLRVRSLATPSP